MTAVKFQDNAAQRSDQKCPVCGTSRAIETLTIEPAPIKAGRLGLFACQGCHSFFYGGPDPVIGYDHSGFEPKYWLHYAQIGAGISAMLMPLMALGERARGSLLDVGCGFGYVPDFWGRSGRGPAVGLESAVYGKIGKEKLGVEIHHQYYNQCEAIAGRKFDIVFSSEVIEHVPDPKAFLSEIGQGLAENGMLVLTTPSASIVRPDADASTLNAALSAGFHFFLASKSALEDTIKAAGFPHVVVRDSGHQLVAWASRQPFAAPDVAAFDWNGYFDYLEHLGRNADASVKGGALYRLFRDCHNTGKFDRAASAYEGLSALAKDTYGIELESPDVGQVLHSADLISRLDTSPAWLSCGLLFGGMHVGKRADGKRTKLRMMDAAVRIFRHDIATSPAFTQEPSHLQPLAEQQYRIGLAEALRSEIKFGIGHITPEGFRPLRANLINEFIGALTNLTGTVVNAMPSASGSVAKGIVAKWRRSIAKRVKTRT